MGQQTGRQVPVVKMLTVQRGDRCHLERLRQEGTSLVCSSGGLRGAFPRNGEEQDLAGRREPEWEEEAAGRGNSKNKGPEVGMCLVCSTVARR